jgi:hypothetical protein
MIKNPLEGDKDWLQPTDRSDYARIRLFMATARENEEISVNGDGIDKLFYDGSHNGCIIRLDHRHAAPIYIDEIKRIKRKFSRIYLTNTADAGKELILGITKSHTCDIVPEDESSVRSDADGYVTGRNQVNVVGGFYNETGITLLTHEQIGACKITDERELHVRAMPPLMSVDILTEYDDAGTDTIAAPGAHYAIEVLGYQINEWANSTFALTSSAYLRFVTSNKYVWHGMIAPETGVITNYKDVNSGLRIRGAENEALTLRNADRAAGNSAVVAVVYYQKVRIN